jgi:hypothetical protein
MQKHLSPLLALLAVGLFITSLFQPAFTCSSKSFTGLEVLVMGWAGLLGLDPRWFANIGFFVLVYRSVFGERKVVPVAIGAVALLALASFAPAAGCAAPGGAPGMSTGLALGGFVWLAAMLAACAANMAASQEVPNIAPPLESTNG